MSATQLDSPDLPLAVHPQRDDDMPWIVFLAGFAIMYLPIYWWAGKGVVQSLAISFMEMVGVTPGFVATQSIWTSDDHAHGLIILLVLIWLFWTLKDELMKAPTRPSLGVGIPFFGFGLVLYFVGRTFNISILEFFSQSFVVGGGLLLLKGTPALRLAWFPVAYFIFMVPLPGVLVDAITGPLKQWISSIVETILYAAGYPISRSGVIISIGQYQLQVADACSGLHSMFSLSALGTLFMYIMDRKSRLHNAIMLASLLPIAFCANIVRVMVLVLITYYLGDEAGQGFLHGTAGMVLMVIALLICFVLDAVLVRLLPERKPAPTPQP